MQCLIGPSFRWAALLFDTSFRYRRSASYSGKVCFLRQPSLCSPRHRVGDNQILIRIIKSTMTVFYSSSRVALLLGFRLLWSLCATQRYSRVLRLLCFPLSCQTTWCACWWVCAMESFEKRFNTQHLPLIFAISLTCLSNVSIVFGLLSNSTALSSYFVCNGAPANRLNRLQCFSRCVYIFLLLFLHLLSIVSLSRLASTGQHR